MDNLFRKDVVDNQGQSAFGNVILSLPFSHVSILILLSALMLGLLTFAVFGDYARKERVQGYIIPDKGIIRILPQQAGILDQSFLEAGKQVAKGDVLFRIKLDTASEGNAGTSETLLAQLSIENDALKIELQSLPAEFSQIRRRLEDRILAAKIDVQNLTQQIQLQEKSVSNQLIMLNRYKALQKSGAASSLELFTQENNHLQASMGLEALKSDRQKSSAQQMDLEAELQLLPVTENKRTAEIMRQIGALERQITKTKGQNIYLVKAPITGRLSSVTARMGQSVQPDKALATILPADGRMEAELLVPTRAAGLLQDGQSVRLLYDAFPYQKFGVQTGKISNVSKTIIQAKDLPNDSLSAEPLFLVRVYLDNQDVTLRGDSYPLQAGMTLSADIVLEKRKIWKWALEPVLGALN